MFQKNTKGCNFCFTLIHCLRIFGIKLEWWSMKIQKKMSIYRCFRQKNKPLIISPPLHTYLDEIDFKPEI